MNSPKLTAQELKRLYCLGERRFEGINLSRESLRGMDLTGINLSRANLSYTDLRGTRFANASLVDANLREVKTGTCRRWAIPKVVFSLWLVLPITSLLSASVGVMFYFISKPPRFLIGDGSIVGTLGFIFLASFLALIYIRGILSTAWITLVSVTILVALAFINSFLSTFASFVLYGAVIFAIVATLEISFTVALTVIFTLARARNVGIAFAVLGTLSVAAIGTAIFDGTDVNINFVIPYLLVAFSSLIATFIVSYLVSRRIVFKGDERDRLIRDIAVRFAAWGATSFQGANLTDANFSGATLKGAHFANAILIRTRFHLAQELNLACLDKTILSDFPVQDLLVTLKGRGKSYVGSNLKGANLSMADLADANLTEADLSQAVLKDAVLHRANFTKTQALATQFQGADFTGACLESWNISSASDLEGSRCEYVYLLNNLEERRPSSGSFRPGEFAKLFKEVLGTIDLIFQNGIDWKAFVKAFEKIQVDNDGKELTIQSIENKGDGVIVVRVDVPPQTDKEKIHSEFKQTYEEIRQQLEAEYKQHLNAKDREIEIYEQQSVQMWSVINRLAERPPVSTVENILGNKVVNDQSQIFQGKVNINAKNSVVNLRDISGQVSNYINQLPTESIPDQPSLKDLLVQLQSAIEADTELVEDAKAEALTEVGEIANAAQRPKEGVMQKAAKGAINALKGIAAGLSDASTLASACKELLPLITSMFGLP